MQKLFNDILVPVDFSKDSQRTFEKVIDMANEYDCNIHLLHVVSISPIDEIALSKGNEFALISLINKQEKLEYELEDLRTKYKDHLHKDKIIYTHLQKGSWDECIINFVLQNKIDVIVAGLQTIGWGKKRTFLNANKIAERVNIPVITIPEDKRLTKLISVVIPVTDFLPVKKLMYGVYVAQNDNATIKLLGVENENDSEQSRKVHHYLQKSFQLIRDNCSVPVEIATTSGHNIAEAINQYAYKNPMDLIIVNPDKKNRISGSFVSFLANIIQRISVPPVLTINHQA